MAVKAYNQTMTEAVGVFHDAERLQGAVDDLLIRGFDHAELSVLANRDQGSQDSTKRQWSVADLEDDPTARRAPYLSTESYGDAEGGIIAACIYVAAITVAAVVASTGGSMLAILAGVVVASTFGFLVGLGLAALLWRMRMRKINEHLSHGGLLLWVRTHDALHEQRALRVLRKHAADDVHLHKIPALPRFTSGIPTRRPALSLGPSA